jgi:hypothetical protein
VYQAGSAVNNKKKKLKNQNQNHKIIVRQKGALMSSICKKKDSFSANCRFALTRFVLSKVLKVHLDKQFVKGLGSQAS